MNEKRYVTGANKKRVDFTDREWEAIQAGAVHDTFLKDLLKNADDKAVKERAMPKTRHTISPARKQRVEQMLSLGYTQEDVARMLDISVGSVNNVVKEMKQG